MERRRWFRRHCSDRIATDPRIANLRNKTQVAEYARFSRDYLDPDKRSIANSVQVFFLDGNCTKNVLVEYPLGHRRRRRQAIPLLKRNFASNFRTRLPEERCGEIVTLFENLTELEKMPVHTFMDSFVV